MIERWYLELKNKYIHLHYDANVIMPNHFHCIIEILGEERRGRPMCLPSPEMPKCHIVQGRTRRFAPTSNSTMVLRAMEKNGMINRTVYNQIPPKVEYSLSELGRQFKPVLDSLEVWGTQYIKFLAKD